MTEYIDREAVRNRVCSGCIYRDGPQGCTRPEPCEDLIGAFLMAPAVDVAPVVRGRWEKNDYSQTVCSHCKVPIPGYWGQYDGCPDGVWTEIEPTICCPNCGAKMEESESK